MYAIIKVVNGVYSIHAEGLATVEAAKVSYHGLCQTLWNAPDVTTAHVMIADEQLDAVDRYKEYIHHEAQAVAVEEPQGE